MDLEVKELAILGTAPSRSQAPFHNDSVTIWGVNGTLDCTDVERVDVVFELHPKRFWGIPQITERLNVSGKPVVMQDHYDEIPRSQKFPRDEVYDKFYLPSMGKCLYVTNTITWMILKGILDGFTAISLYGVHMEHETEYSYQQPNVSWAAGLVQGMGLIDPRYSISVAGDSTLFKARYEYGFEEPSDLMRMMADREDALKHGMDAERNKMVEAKENMLRTEGAMREAEHWRKVVSGQK